MSNTFWTIISGVLVFVLSQLYNEYRLKPIQKYKELRGKISYTLTFYANLYMNPVKIESLEQEKERQCASYELRKLASETDAMAELKPFFCFVIPEKRKLADVSKNLTGLSNGFYSSHADYLMRDNDIKRNEVYRLLKMKKYEKR